MGRYFLQQRDKLEKNERILWKKVQKDLKNAGAEGRMETYRLEHAAWEKQNANKEALSAERNKSALAIAAALGKTRGDDVLKNENAEKKVQTARVSKSIDECTNGALKMASHLVDMMERDPQLKEMAAASFEERENAMCERHKEFAAPRTMNDLIQNVKGHEKMREVRQVAAAAQEKLLNDRAGKLTLSEQEKKDCLRDVLKGEFIGSLYATQTNIFDKKAVQKMDPLTNAVQKYETDPKLSI